MRTLRKIRGFAAYTFFRSTPWNLVGLRFKDGGPDSGDIDKSNSRERAGENDGTRSCEAAAHGALLMTLIWVIYHGDHLTPKVGELGGLCDETQRWSSGMGRYGRRFGG